ncbi:MAG: murein biosynthesis integral membrane protein MurJ [Planctomycetota bacterium]|jgi:putative peptidoglycan lipid II flippase|nr:murein biosynthesis integral membrane protein MurJ [Planctomycetota bacterium]
MTREETPRAPSYIRWAGTVSGLTLVSRILGLLRDVGMAAAFGSGVILDAFLLAFTLPNLLRKIFGEGALASAFVPVYSATLSREGREPASRLARTVGTLLATVLVLLVLVGVGICLLGIQYGSPGEETRLALRLSAIMAPYLFLVCFAAFLGSILNSHDRFLVPALPPVVFNLSWLLALAFLVPPLLESGGAYRAIHGLAAAVLVGGLCQVGLQVPSVLRQIGPPRPRYAWSEPGVARIRKTMIPVVFGLAIFQLNVFADRLIAWWLVPEEGAITVLYLANRLVQFPLALIALAVATAIFPSLSRQAAEGDRESVASLTREALRLVLFLTLPAAAGLALLGTPVCSLFFERGAFSSAASDRTGQVLLFYCLALPFLASISILTKTYHAQGDTRTPVRAGIVAVVIGLTGNLLLARPMGAPGLALATAAAALVNLALLVRGSKKTLGPLWASTLPSSGLRTVGLTLISLIPAAALRQFGWPPLPTVAIGIPSAILLYLGLAAGTRNPEWTDLLRRLRRPDR